MTRLDAPDTPVEILQVCTHAGTEYAIGATPTLPRREALKLKKLGRARLLTPPTDDPSATPPRKRTRKPRGDAQ